MNKFIDFCIESGIRFNISDVGYWDDENPAICLKEVVIELYKYNCKGGKHVGLAELRDEGLDLEDICLDFAKNFNDFCEKVGE